MAGHSKWANIKRKKEANDAKRSNIFTKMTRLITTAVQEGGGIADPEINFKLRVAIERARSVNMPNDTIQRAIDKATGEGLQMKEMLYEGFGPGGVGMLIAAITDNGNRTHSELRTLLDKQGGKMASANAVSYMFQQCGVVEFAKSDISQENMFVFFDAIEGIDFEETDDSYVIYIPFENIGKVKGILSDVKPKTLDIYYRAENPIKISDDQYKKLERITSIVEDHDDVQGVYTNVDEVQ